LSVELISLEKLIPGLGFAHAPVIPKGITGWAMPRD